MGQFSVMVAFWAEICCELIIKNICVMAAPPFLFVSTTNRMQHYKRISLAFREALYECSGLYRTKVVINFGGCNVPKKCNFYDFQTPTPQKLPDIGCRNFARMLFSVESICLLT
jgi:hypothetical protein